MTADGAAVLLDRFARWGVEPDGPPWRTPSSVLGHGRLDGRPVVGKLALVEEERRGGRLLAAWSGRGAVPVLRHDDEALLMVRATGRRDLTAMATGGRDDAATAVLADLVAVLHAAPPPPAGVGPVPLEDWFAALTAERHADPLLAAAADAARRALADTRAEDEAVLHGDVHHGNVLDLGAPVADAAGTDGWAAVDPKALRGHRAFDFANLLLNPDRRTAESRLDARLDLLTTRSGLDRAVLERWTLAWCGLSLAWRRGVEDEWHARTARAVGGVLAARLSPS